MIRRRFGRLAWSAVGSMGLLAGPLAAQVAASGGQGAEAIVAAEVARHLRALAADSLRSRDTPSRGLELTAAYVVAELTKLGLAPGAQDSQWIQRYDPPADFYLDRDTRARFARQIVIDKRPIVSEDGWMQPVRSTWMPVCPAGDTLDRSLIARTLFGEVPVVVVAGRQTAQSARKIALHGKHALYIPPTGIDAVEERQVLDALVSSSVAVDVVEADDSAAFARCQQAVSQRRFRMVDSYSRASAGRSRWLGYLWAPDVRAELAGAGLDLAALQAAATPVAQELPMSWIGMMFQPDTSRGPALVTAPNVIAVLPGSDPRLKRELIVIATHMDNGGVVGGPTDNAAGVAGLLALATAFSQPGARPKRSLLFVVTSGGASDWWGSRFFEMSLPHRSEEHVVATMSLDAIGRAMDDSVVVDGITDVAGVMSPQWVAASHPELKLAVIDGGPIGRAVANHGAFVVRGEPNLFFHRRRAGTRPTQDTSSAVNEAYVTRVLRLMFYVGAQLADTASSPRWSEAGERRLRQAFLSD